MKELAWCITFQKKVAGSKKLSYRLNTAVELTDCCKKQLVRNEKVLVG